MHVKVSSAAYHALARYGLEKLALGPAGWGGLVGAVGGAVGGGIYGYTREPDDDHLGRRLVRTGLGVAGGGTAGLVAGALISKMLRSGVAPPATNTQHTVIDSPASEIAPPASALPVHPKMKTVPGQLRHVPHIWEMDIQKQVPDHLRDEYTRRVHHSDSVVDPVATFRELTGKDPTAHSWISPEFSPEQLQEMWHRHKQEQIDRTAAIMRGEDVDF